MVAKASAKHENEAPVTAAAAPFVSPNAWQIGDVAEWYVPFVNYSGPHLTLHDGQISIHTFLGDIEIRKVEFPDRSKAPVEEQFTVTAPPAVQSILCQFYEIDGAMNTYQVLHRLFRIKDNYGIISFAFNYRGEWMPKVCADVLLWVDAVIIGRNSHHGTPERVASGITLGQLLGGDGCDVDETVYDLARALFRQKTLSELDRFVAREKLSYPAIVKLLASVAIGEISAKRRISEITTL